MLLVRLLSYWASFIAGTFIMYHFHMPPEFRNAAMTAN